MSGIRMNFSSIYSYLRFTKLQTLWSKALLQSSRQCTRFHLTSQYNRCNLSYVKPNLINQTLQKQQTWVEVFRFGQGSILEITLLEFENDFLDQMLITRRQSDLNSISSCQSSCLCRVFAQMPDISREQDQKIGGLSLQGREVKKKLHFVDWNSICKPKKNGGLSIKPLKVMNQALLGKWLQRLREDNEGG